MSPAFQAGMSATQLGQQSSVNPIQNTMADAMQSELKAASGGVYPPSVMNMVLSSLKNPHGQSPTQIATSLIDSFLAMAITTPQPPAAAGTAVAPPAVNNSPPLDTAQIPADKLSLFQSATAGLARCAIEGSQGFCMPPMMQTVCQNMKLKIAAAGCTVGQICCARKSD